jgi:hypothetical protein
MGNLSKRIRNGKAAVISREILAKLRADKYSSPIPGTLRLAKEFKANKNTVDKGHLVRIQGKGSYPAWKIPSLARNKTRNNSRRYAFIVDN